MHVMFNKACFFGMLIFCLTVFCNYWGKNFEFSDPKPTIHKIKTHKHFYE